MAPKPPPTQPGNDIRKTLKINGPAVPLVCNSIFICAAPIVVDPGQNDGDQWSAPLVERLRIGARLNVPDRATFFGGSAARYTDYPVLTPAERDAA